MKNLKVAFCSFMVGILFALSAAVALAATATGPYMYYSEYGYNYKARNSVSNDYGVVANTSVYSDGSGNIPTGYMGVKARLFENDSLYMSSNWYYNPSPYAGIGINTEAATSSGIYSSWGYTRAYDGGGGYTTYAPSRSPNINY